MPNQQMGLDRVFHALTDATRRAVLHRLTRGEAAVSELAAPFEMALPSFLQHLKVLESSGLVQSEKAGRVRTYRLSPEPLASAEGWIAEQRGLWNARLNQLDNYLLQLKQLQSTRVNPLPNTKTRKKRREH